MPSTIPSTGTKQALSIEFTAVSALFLSRSSAAIDNGPTVQKCLTDIGRLSCVTQSEQLTHNPRGWRTINATGSIATMNARGVFEDLTQNCRMIACSQRIETFKHILAYSTSTTTTRRPPLSVLCHCLLFSAPGHSSLWYAEAPVSPTKCMCCHHILCTAIVV